MSFLPNRSDQTWIDALTGKLGPTKQHEYCETLAIILFRVAYHSIYKRRNHLPKLANLDDRELELFAEDFVQQFMEKMLSDDYALLGKYSGHGRFTSWAKQVMMNLLSSELRRTRWRRQVPLPEQTAIPNKDILPEVAVMRHYLSGVLGKALSQLSERSRVALVRFVVDGDSAIEIAEDMDVTPNTVHIWVYRAKKKMREYLEKEGIKSSAFGTFSF